MSACGIGSAVVSAPASAGSVGDPVITRYAGVSGAYGAPVAGPALSSNLSIPWGVAADDDGNLYIGDEQNHTVEKVTPGGQLSVVAGQPGVPGTPHNGPATATALKQPDGVAVAPDGGVLVADSGASEVYEISAAGRLTIIAGTGLGGYPTPGPATASRVYDPVAVAADSGGNIYIADSNSNRIDKVSPSGALTIIAGNGTTGLPSPGGPATSSSVWNPRGVAVAPDGSVYISDTLNDRVERIDPGTGTLSVVAGSGVHGAPVPGAATSSPLAQPTGLTFDRAGNLYIADGNNHDVEKVTPGGQLSLVAGRDTSGVPSYGDLATASYLHGPRSIAVGPLGQLFIADAFNQTIDLVAPAAPQSTAGPMVSGTPTVGGSLSATRGLWSNDPNDYRDQWQRCDSSGSACVDIQGATADSYTPTSDDAGHTIRDVVTARNGGGSTTAYSDAVLVPAPTTASPPPATTVSTPGTAAPAPATTAPAPASLTPTAAASVTPAVVGLSYTFSALGSTAVDGSSLQYRWTLDGQVIGTGAVVSHTFPAAGRAYAVVLTVTDAAGHSSTQTITVTPRLRRAVARLIVHFDLDRADLRAGDRRMLARLRGVFAGASRITVTGYCAAREEHRSHLLTLLSTDRSDAVLRLLQAHGNATHARVRIAGQGATHFARSNRTATGRAYNRRAVITIEYQKPIV